jgi:hypothetical protein
LGQKYPNYKLVFVTNTESDPAYELLRDVLWRKGGVVLETAGIVTNRSLKINSQLKGLEFVENASVLAFADSDVQPDENWLQHLVEPLEDPTIGATSGYPWHIPRRNNLGSLLTCLRYNIGAVFSFDRKNSLRSLWGGSMAIRKSTFDKARIAEAWSSAYLDDSVMSHRVRELGLALRFVPECITPVHVDFKFKDYLNALEKYFVSCRVYDYKKWLLLGFELFASLAVYVGGPLLLFFAKSDIEEAIYLSTLCASMLSRTFVACLSLQRVRKRRDNLMVFLLPLLEMTALAYFVRSVFSNEVHWRGSTYRLSSPSMTEVLSSGEATLS